MSDEQPTPAEAAGTGAGWSGADSGTGAGHGPGGHGPGGHGTGPAADGPPPPHTVGRRPDRPTRSRRPRVVAGVCTGLGRYFDVDPVLFRVPLAILAVVGGLGLVAYGFAWLFLPAEDERENEVQRLLSGRGEGGSLLAVLVALIGCALFLTSFGIRTTPFSLMLGCVVMGAAVWSRRRRQAGTAGAVGAHADPATAYTVEDAPPEAQAPPAPGAPSWWRESLADKDAPAGSSPAGGLGQPDGPGGPDGLNGPGGAGDPGVPDGAGTGFWARRRRFTSIGGLVTVLAAAVCVVTGTGRPSFGFACALGVFGLGMVVSAFVGRIGVGTYAMALVTAVLLTVSVVLSDIPHVSNHVFAPQSAGALRSNYGLSTGYAKLDLRHVSPTAKHRTLNVRAHVGAGKLVVVLPPDVRAEVDGKVDAGRISAQRDGPPVPQELDASAGVSQRLRTTLRPVGDVQPKGTLRVHASGELGSVEFLQADRARGGTPGDRHGSPQQSHQSRHESQEETR